MHKADFTNSKNLRSAAVIFFMLTPNLWVDLVLAVIAENKE